MNWFFLAGIVIFVLGMMLSIGLHELGHMIPAKIFGVRVPQYMIGFGSTMWSIKRGETEYGVKWIPFGGYIRMIGMLPPRPGDDPTKLRGASTGPFQGLIDAARDVAQEEVRPGDEDRVFYRKKWWQKVIIMSGGPAMNFVLSFVIFAVLLMGFGLPTNKPTVSAMSACVIPYSQVQADPDRKCTPADQVTPAVKAGMKPGDKIVSFNGAKITSWDSLVAKIRANGAGQIDLGIVRDGKPQTLKVDLIAQDRPKIDDVQTIEKGVGFLGVLPTQVVEKQGLGHVFVYMGDLTGKVFESLLNLPQKMVGIWHAAFSGDERD